MKKLALLLITTSLLTSCNNNCKLNTNEELIKSIKSVKIDKNFTKIGEYKLAAGNLYIYKFGNDTIYWAEGNSNCPVSLK